MKVRKGQDKVTLRERVGCIQEVSWSAAKLLHFSPMRQVSPAAFYHDQLTYSGSSGVPVLWCHEVNNRGYSIVKFLPPAPYNGTLRIRFFPAMKEV